jgi:hypothetical protein
MAAGGLTRIRGSRRRTPVGGRQALILVVLAAPWLQPETRAQDQVADPARERRMVVKATAGCEAALEWRAVEPALVHYRNDCAQPLAEKTHLLASLLEQLVPDLQGRAGLHTLFAGRMALTFPEIARRIALAGARHPDLARARRNVGLANRLYVQLGNQPGMYPELPAALAPLGYSVSLAVAEKVLVGGPQDTPFAQELLGRGLSPNDRIAFDAMVWFRLIYSPPAAAARDR